MRKKESGDQGEALAARYLEERGYEILDRQWRCRYGELDLAAALPYLAGGLIGGWVGGRVFQKMSMVWLRRGFALLLLYGGVRAFL